MKARFIEITNKSIKIYDAQITIKELIFDFVINFLYAFAANLMVPFIVVKHDFGIFISFFLYYYLLSYILNRDKYESKFGRYIMLPVPCIFGAYFAIKIGYVIVNLIT